MRTTLRFHSFCFVSFLFTSLVDNLLVIDNVVRKRKTTRTLFSRKRTFHMQKVLSKIVQKHVNKASKM